MADCKTIEEVRENIDRIDREIVELVSQRSRYVVQAAKFKKTREDVKTPSRVEEVILKVRNLAVETDLDPDIVEKIYRTMIACFIDYELKVHKRMNTFDNVSGQYQEKAIIQHTAASNLLSLIKIRKSDSVIDIACGPGHITYMLSKITSGKVTGIDISEGMIRQAKKLYPGIDFRQIAAEDIDYENEFDIAFCNSSLMWFVNPGKAIKGISNALKTGGRIALACPATSDWSPWLGRIISRVTASGDIKDVFSHWKSPWFFLPAKEDYEVFFGKQGFNMEYIEIKNEITDYSIEEAYNIYLSGAGNGFTGKKYYDIEIDDDFFTSFNDHVKEEIRKEATNGRLNVEFNRLYYIGKKLTN